MPLGELAVEVHRARVAIGPQPRQTLFDAEIGAEHPVGQNLQVAGAQLGQGQRGAADFEAHAFEVVVDALVGQLAAQAVYLIVIAVKHIVAAQPVLLGLAVQFDHVVRQLLVVLIGREAGEPAEGKRAVRQRIEQGIGAVIAVSRVFQRAAGVQADEVRQAERAVQRGGGARQPLAGAFWP